MSSSPHSSADKREKIRVMLADDHLVVRMGLASVLKFEKGLEVVAQVEDGRQAVETWRKVRPDVTVMDLRMPVLDGIAATVAIRAEDPGARILILTTYEEPQEIRRALKAGALGCLLKNASQTLLAKAIREVHAGHPFVMREIELRLKEEEGQLALSERHLELLRLLARGLTNKDIARQFGITTDGVKSHLTHLFAKMGVANRTEAVALALRERLLQEE
jgi:two-component system NarL family response regulator